MRRTNFFVILPAAAIQIFPFALTAAGLGPGIVSFILPAAEGLTFGTEKAKAGKDWTLGHGHLQYVEFGRNYRHSALNQMQASIAE